MRRVKRSDRGGQGGSGLAPKGVPRRPQDRGHGGPQLRGGREGVLAQFCEQAVNDAQSAGVAHSPVQRRAHRRP